MEGTGFPEALHSKVTAPPFRAVICPLDGTARTLGGTENLISKIISHRRRALATENKQKSRTTKNASRCFFYFFFFGFSMPLLASNLFGINNFDIE
jgi:polyferredoxin